MKKSFLLYVIIVGLIQIGCNKEKPIDIILYNGSIFTSDTSNLYVEALAIRENRIVQTGDSEVILSLKSENTKLIDLKGKLAIPGFNDAHFHLTNALNGNWLNMSSMNPDFIEVLNVLKDTIKEINSGERIFGTIGENVILNPDVNRYIIDSIAPDNPVYLLTYLGGHGDLINTRAMIEMGIEENQADPIGGFYDRFGDSEILTGKIYEYASWNLQRKLSKLCPDELILESYDRFGKNALKYGITSIQNMPLMPLSRFVDLWSESNLPIRMRVIRFTGTDDEKSSMEDLAIPENPVPNKSIKVHGLKWILDGTPIERGAAQRQAYADLQDHFGRMNFDQPALDSFISVSLSRDEQLLLHCTGDSAAKEVMMAMKRLGDGINWSDKRPRIEHGDGINGDLLSLAKELGIIVVQNPTHFTNGEILKSRYLNPEYYIPLKSFLENDIHVSIGSDGPNNPFLNLMLAVQHPSHPEEGISLEEAVIAYTYEAAYAEFDEQRKGSISVGKLADIVVLSQNIFELPIDQILDTESIMTIIDGDIVYDKGEL